MGLETQIADTHTIESKYFFFFQIKFRIDAIPVGVGVGVGVRMLYRKHTVDQTKSRICFKYTHNMSFGKAKVWLDFGISVFKGQGDRGSLFAWKCTVNTL